MLKKTILLFLGIIVSLSSNIHYGNDLNKKIAVIQSYSGLVSVKRNNQTLTAKVGMLLDANDDITTDRTGTVLMVFKNSVRISLLPDSRIVLNQISGENNNQYSIIQHAGTVLSKVISLTGGTKYEVNTPTSVVGVRGTNFTSVISIDGSTGVVVEEGKVEMVQNVQEQSAPSENSAEDNSSDEGGDNTRDPSEQTITVNSGQQAEYLQETNQISVSPASNPEEFRRTWRERRLEIFKKRYPVILNRMLFRLERAERFNKRAFEWLEFETNRIKNSKERVEQGIKSGRPFAIRRIKMQIKRISMRSFRVIRRLRIMNHRIRSVYHNMNRIEKNLSDHPVVRDAKFIEFRERSKKLYKEIISNRKIAQKKIRYIRSTIKKWKKMLRNSGH